MTETYRLYRNEALQIPEIYELIHTAFSSNVMVEDPDEAVNEISQQLHRPELGLFIVGDEEAWQGVALAQWSPSAFNRGCVVIHFFNRGDKEARTALMEALVGYAREGGYDKLIGVDTNNKPQAYARLFSAVGEPVFTGQVVVFDMNESLV